MSRSHLVRAVADTLWHVTPGMLQTILEVVARHDRGERLSAAEVKERVGQRGEQRNGQRAGGVEVLPIYGVITPRATLMSEWSGGTSVEALRNSFMAAVDDDDVKAILLDVDSPGGSVELVHELATDIRQARERKPVIAQANTLMASAAYHLASAASEVFATPTGQVGSVGVFGVHEDWSEHLKSEGIDITLVSAGRYKVEGNPYEPLDSEAKAHLQSLVDAAYDLFVADVAAGRGVAEGAVRDGMGQGRLLDAKRAKTTGLIDGVQTFEQTARALMRSGETGRAQPLTGEAEPEVVASGGEHPTFVDQAAKARDAVAAVVTRMQALREVREGRLTAAKREQLDALTGSLAELGEAIDKALNTVPAPEAGEHLDLEVESSLASAEARLRVAI